MSIMVLIRLHLTLMVLLILILGIYMIYSYIMSWSGCYKVVVIYPQSVPVLVIVLSNNNISRLNTTIGKIF